VIFFELAHRNPFFYDSSEIGVLFKIFKLYGTPTNEQWEGVEKLKYYKKTFPKFKGEKIADMCPRFDCKALDLFSKMIALNPVERISAKMALEHEYFND